MSTSSSTLDYILECLSWIPELRAKAMFGEYGIYSGEKMFALACDGILFFKTFPETIEFFEDTNTKAYPWSRNTAPANPDWLENGEELLKIANLTISLTPPPKPKKKRC
jgi:DNA transformation protein